jgi:hypothetical protein
VLVLLCLVIRGTVLLSGITAPSTSASVTPSPSGLDARASNRSGDGIHARDADSALRAFSWRADGWEGDLSDADSAQTFLAEEPQKRAPAGGWATGYADDGEFGDKILECRRRFQRTVNDECNIGLRLAVLQEGEGDATSSRVVAVEADVDETMGASCYEFAACIGNAWKGRTGPSLEATNGEVVKLAFRDKMLRYKHETLRDLTDRELASIYESCVAEYTKELDDMKAYYEMLLEVGTEDQPYMDNYYVALALHEARIADCTRTAKVLATANAE